MRAPLLACVPNVSEGRDLHLIDRLTAAIESVAETRLLHRDIGADANRTVFTFVGSPAAVRLSAKRLARACVSEIDLRGYSGTHPYIGALDVCPFVAMWGLDPHEAHWAAQDLGSYCAEQLALPVYFYEHSAQREAYRSLAHVRRGGLAHVAKRVPADAPDLGDPVPHPSAGVTVTGARDILVAFNINLDTPDEAVAKMIAREVRKLPKVRAIGWYQAAFACAQVSVNLLDYRVTGLADVYLALDRAAQGFGCRAVGSELIGMLPEAALLQAAPTFQKAELSGIALSIAVLAQGDPTQVLAQADPTQVLAEANATQVFAQADSSQVLAHADASQVLVPADASQVLAHADATQVLVPADATQVLAPANASQVLAQANATQVLAQADASQVFAQADASQVLAQADATQVFAHADQAVQSDPEPQPHVPGQPSAAYRGLVAQAAEYLGLSAVRPFVPEERVLEWVVDAIDRQA